MSQSFFDRLRTEQAIDTNPPSLFVRSMKGTGIALVEKKKWMIKANDELVRVADGPTPYAILRDISADGLLCGARVLSACVFGVNGMRSMTKVNALDILYVARDALAKELLNIDELASKPNPNSTMVRLRDAIAAEVNEGDITSSSSSSSSLSSPQATSTRPTESFNYPYYAYRNDYWSSGVRQSQW
jgi:hypothetical protein